MTEKQENHVVKLKQEFGRLMTDKYRKGAAEHGGDLWLVPKEELLDMAIDEAIDQVVYLLTLKEKHEKS